MEYSNNLLISFLVRSYINSVKNKKFNSKSYFQNLKKYQLSESEKKELINYFKKDLKLPCLECLDLYA